MADQGRSNPSATGMVIAGLLAVFVGLWMVGQTMATEGEVIKQKLADMAGEIETMNFELKAMNDKLDRMRGEATAEHGGNPPVPAPAAANEDAE